MGQTGGGPGNFGSSPIRSNSYERIVDLAIDSDNNYYYLAEISGAHYSDLVSYDGQELHTYNSSDNDRDIYVFSTDSDGDFRWDKMIGGGFNDMAASINIDEDNYVYVSGTAVNDPYTSPAVHFDNDTIKTSPEPNQADPMNKSAFLIKYDQDGNYQWLQEPEGVNQISYDLYLYNALVLKTVVDPDGTSHSLIRFGPGTHLNGQLQVPEGDEYPQAGYKVAMVNYDSSGVLEGFFTLDMKPVLKPYGYQLAYDPNLDRYYIGDAIRSTNDTLSINGYGADSGAYDNAFYLAAVNNQGEVLWYHGNHNIDEDYALGDLQLDESGNIYLAGMFDAGGSNNGDSFAGYEFTMTGDVASGSKSPFLVKLTPDGGLLWGTNSESYSPFKGQSIAIDGNDVYLGLGMLQNTWGDIDIPAAHDQGHVPDIEIMRFNSQSGVPQEVIHNTEITSTNDQIMALGVDGNHDLVTGGFFGSSLFYDTNFAISNSGGPSDFFIAKYETDKEDNPCATPTDVTVGNIEAHSVDVSWTSVGEETQWTVLYGEPGFNPDTEGSSLTVNTTPETTLEDLEPETDYAVYVRAFCDEDSHSSWTGSVSFTTEDLGVEAHQTQVLKIYPNPTKDLLNIQTTKNVQLEKVTVYNLQGRELLNFQQNLKTLNLEQLSAGMYILKIKTNQGTMNQQLIKQ